MAKIFYLIFVLSTLIVLFTSCQKSENDNIPNTVYNTSYQSDVTNSSNVDSYIALENSEIQNILEYKLKDNYYSREEIAQELENIHSSYNEYKLKTESQNPNALENYNYLCQYLTDLANAMFPLSEKELEDKKIEAFRQLVADLKPFKPFITDGAMSLYENALSIETEFDEGRITIDEALIKYHQTIGLPEDSWIYQIMFTDSGSPPLE